MGLASAARLGVLAHISIHPSRVGWDLLPYSLTSVHSVFQSTHPVWDGTAAQGYTVTQTQISIHPSRVGWDQRGAGAAPAASPFQSTHPVWDGTSPASFAAALSGISIHPSRVGWDELLRRKSNDRSISIHPSRVGWDLESVRRSLQRMHFNPPIPCGMGLIIGWSLPMHSRLFQSTHPVWDGTWRRADSGERRADFNPPIPCGMGPKGGLFLQRLKGFQSTHPVWDGT